MHITTLQSSNIIIHMSQQTEAQRGCELPEPHSWRSRARVQTGSVNPCSSRSTFLPPVDSFNQSTNFILSAYDLTGAEVGREE